MWRHIRVNLVISEECHLHHVTSIYFYHNIINLLQEIRSHVTVSCRCHGITGSCQQNICWRSKPPIRDVSTRLFQEYNSAVKVRVKNSRLQPPKSKRPLELSDLVYLKKSPKFCKENLSKGSYGTVGRRCNATSTGPEGCDDMCCNRGFKEVTVQKITKCNCKFEWCCKVNCDICRERRIEHYCKWPLITSIQWMHLVHNKNPSKRTLLSGRSRYSW